MPAVFFMTRTAGARPAHTVLCHETGDFFMEKTVCELFAGVGGFRLGLEAADPAWKTVWMNQWEPSRKHQDAYDCYCAHFGHKKEYVNEDIASIDKKTIPDHTLLVGGFPCQDYSVAHTGAKASSVAFLAKPSRLPAYGRAAMMRRGEAVSSSSLPASSTPRNQKPLSSRTSRTS